MIVDSSVWIEILKDGPLAGKCQKAMLKQKIQIPTLVLFEVYKKLKVQSSEDIALEAVAHLSQYEVQDLSREVAMLAADLSIQHNLAMADSLVLAHAELSGAPLLTLDNDFSAISIARVVR